jgi:hypothetical protein
MIRKIVVFFALAFFLLSSSATVEQFWIFDTADSQASLAVGAGDLAPATISAFGLKRLVRAKSAAKPWILAHWVTPKVGLEWSKVETSLSHPISKYDVYQQMNVYRL